jgi:hypothetical protein
VILLFYFLINFSSTCSIVNFINNIVFFSYFLFNIFPTLYIPLPHLLLPFPLNSLLSLLFHFSPVLTPPHTTPYPTTHHYTTPPHQPTKPHTTPHYINPQPTTHRHHTSPHTTGITKEISDIGYWAQSLLLYSNLKSLLNRPHKRKILRI